MGGRCHARQERDAIAPGGWDTLGLPDVPQLLLGPAGHPEAVTWKSPADRPGKRRHAQVRALRTRTHMKGSARPIVDAGAGDLHVRRRRQRRTIRLEPQHPAFDHRAAAGEIEATRAPAGEEAGKVLEVVALRTRSALRRDQQGAAEERRIDESETVGGESISGGGGLERFPGLPIEQDVLLGGDACRSRERLFEPGIERVRERRHHRAQARPGASRIHVVHILDGREAPSAAIRLGRFARHAEERAHQGDRHGQRAAAPDAGQSACAAPAGEAQQDRLGLVATRVRGRDAVRTRLRGELRESGVTRFPCRALQTQSGHIERLETTHMERQAQPSRQALDVRGIGAGLGPKPVIHVADGEADPQFPGASRQRAGERDGIRTSRACRQHRRARWQQIGGGEERQLHGIAGHPCDSTGGIRVGGMRYLRSERPLAWQLRLRGDCVAPLRTDTGPIMLRRAGFSGVCRPCALAPRVSQTQLLRRERAPDRRRGTTGADNRFWTVTGR